MLPRCCNPNNPKYNYYGGRGITVCQEWQDSFEAFCKWALENGYVFGVLDPEIECQHRILNYLKTKDAWNIIIPCVFLFIKIPYCYATIGVCTKLLFWVLTEIFFNSKGRFCC